MLYLVTRGFRTQTTIARGDFQKVKGMKLYCGDLSLQNLLTTEDTEDTKVAQRRNSN